MLNINLDLCRQVFDREVTLQKQQIMANYQRQEASKRIEAIDKKVIHTDEVIKDGLKVCRSLNFNKSVRDFAYVALMDHDIGRFEQMRIMGNYVDSDLQKDTLYRDHGELGSAILEKRIEEQLPHAEVFHKPIRKIVADHVNAKHSHMQLRLLSSNLLSKFAVEELLVCGDMQDNVINCITQIVQDVDRLDIYHQILDGRWSPNKSDEPINDQVFERFYDGDYLDMNVLKKNGLWNVNVGELVRLSFINQVKLLCVAKLIQDEKIIPRLKEIRRNPKAMNAFDYMEEKLDEMIKTSPDGVVVGKVKRLKSN